MCSNKRYTTQDDQYIVDVVRKSKNNCIGFEKAAKKLNRSPNAIMQRYYQRLMHGKPKRKAVVAGDPFGKTTSKFSMSKHQKMLDKDVRFTLASLAKGHQNITVTIQGKQVTAVFK